MSQKKEDYVHVVQNCTDLKDKPTAVYQVDTKFDQDYSVYLNNTVGSELLGAKTRVSLRALRQVDLDNAPDPNSYPPEPS
jgi:hypothetical protein